ncbi:metallophosphoesterase [Vibrio sp. FNV 38]|nr:metallophosphoesterase [Vibrio sp. FNV 38]
MSKITKHHLHQIFAPLDDDSFHRSYRSRESYQFHGSYRFHGDPGYQGENAFRGNSALWTMYQETLCSRDFAMTADELITWVVEFTERVIVESLLGELVCGEVDAMNASVYSDYGFQINARQNKTKCMKAIDSALQIEVEQFVHTVLDHNNSWAALFEHNDEPADELGQPRYEPCLFVSGLNQGGMSGGGFDVRCWTESMLPILKQRCVELEKGLTLFESYQRNELLFVGDIHGRKDKLDALLSQALIESRDTLLVFVGDLIDNTSSADVDHVALLQGIKQKTDCGEAVCLLGNHEFNAIGWFLTNALGQPCRAHSVKNRVQHEVFLQQVGENSTEHKAWITWFQSLPLYLNFGTFGAVHACWHKETLARIQPYLNDDNSLKSAHWLDAFDPSHELYEMIEVLLKGPEIRLPDGVSFKDRYGNERHDIRVAWWKEDSLKTYRDLALVAEVQRGWIPDIALPSRASHFNQLPDIPVVIGHYSFSSTPYPELLNRNVACVDFNAAQAESPLVGLYAWVKEKADASYPLLDANQFCFVEQPEPSRIVENGIAQVIEQSMTRYPQRIEHVGFASIVSEALLNAWDPLGVFEECMDDAMTDEYLTYEADVMCLAQFGDVDVLAGHLALIQTHIMGVEVKDQGLNCSRVAHRLVDAWRCITADA